MSCGGRRGARDEARPRRERRAVARAAGRPRHRRALRRRARRPLARLRRPRRAALRADARRRLPGRGQLGRDGAGRAADRRARPRASARSPGPTRCTTGRTAAIDVDGWDVDVLICSPYKFFGPHMGMAFGKKDLIGCWRPYKVRPAADEPVGHRFELGTCQHELLAGFVAAVDYVDSIGWDAIARPRARARPALPRRAPGRTSRSTACRRWKAGCRRSASTSPAARSEEVATHLADERDVAVWWGNYYALETMRRLGLDECDGRRPRRHRPLQHDRGGRPPARRARGARCEAPRARRHAVRRPRRRRGSPRRAATT